MALLVTVHEHSRFVVTVSVPVAPADATLVVMEFATDTWHFAAEGAVTPIEVDVHDNANSDKAAARTVLRRIKAAVAMQDA